MKFEKDVLMGLLKGAETEGIFNKAVAGFILPDGSREILTLNTPENTVFDIASLTKVCPTSTLALSYIFEGKLSVDTKVISTFLNFKQIIAKIFGCFTCLRTVSTTVCP